jgi:hypothetical protein
MIDRLHQTPPPLPPRPAAQESQSGVPSFLEWALSNPGPDAGANPQHGGHADPDGQHDGLALSAHATSAPATSVVPGTIDPELALLPPNLPGDPLRAHPGLADASLADPSLADPRMPVPGLPTSPASDPSALVPGDPSIAVSAVVDPQDFATQTLQVHLRKPQGEREVVSLPWRLAAGGRLDQSLRVPGMVAPPGMASSSTPVGGVSSANPGMAVFDALGRLQTPGLSPGARASDEGALLPGMMRIAARAGDASAAATLGAASAPIVSEWLSRWMKWIERDGHDPVVLLRDYRMDGDETRRVVDTLREFAREHGVVLDRVVVNGHEFWRNQNSDSTRE